jgi:hypothetical protein
LEYFLGPTGDALNILGGTTPGGRVGESTQCLKFEAHCSDRKVCKTCIVGSI